MSKEKFYAESVVTPGFMTCAGRTCDLKKDLAETCSHAKFMTSALLIGRKRSNGPTVSAIISQVPRASGKPEAAGLQILSGHIRQHSRIPPFTSNTGKPCLATPTCCLLVAYFSPTSRLLS